MLEKGPVKMTWTKPMIQVVLYFQALPWAFLLKLSAVYSGARNPRMKGNKPKRQIP